MTPNRSSRAEPFFRVDATRAALHALAEKDNLVIYCGAGVTRDRTGLGWGELVTEVFDGVRSRRNRDRAADDDLAAVLKMGDLDPAQKASVVVQAGKPGSSSETRFLTPLLHSALYREHGWSQGNLLRNVAELARVNALFGSDVTLITTNYDDYIDRELVELIEANGRFAQPDEPVPGVTLHIVGKTNQSRVLCEARNGGGTISIHHLHGRVDSAGNAEGQIVFSESSYSVTRGQTVDFLYPRFNEASAFLSVGASLNDAPLIEALFRANQSIAWRRTLPVKVALLTPSGSTPEEQRARLGFTVQRGKHLGIDILVADNFAQVAQFVEELRLTTQLRRVGRLDRYETDASYPVSLRSWWRDWDHASWSSQHDEHHLVMSDTLEAVRAFFHERGIAPNREILRLELWVRLDPSVSRDHRHLTQYANSTGPLYAVGALRSEPITTPTDVASVRAFTVGKPLLLGLDDLNHPEHATRWKSFLSVPLEREMQIDFGGFSVSRTIPVGVVTLASTLPNTAAGASFARRSLSVPDYEELLTLIRNRTKPLVIPTGFEPEN